MPNPAKAMDQIKCPGCQTKFLVPRRGGPPVVCPRCGLTHNFEYMTRAELGQYFCSDCLKSNMDCTCGRVS